MLASKEILKMMVEVRAKREGGREKREEDQRSGVTAVRGTEVFYSRLPYCYVVRVVRGYLVQVPDVCQSARHSSCPGTRGTLACLVPQAGFIV